jgi:hypothetical protein
MKLRNTGLVAAVLAAGSLAFAAPAQAHGDDAAIAIGAGVVGLAVGAAIASDHNRSDVYVRYNSRPRYYGGGYYYPAYPAYPVYRAYPAYRPYPAWRGYDPRYDQNRRWREHERWENHERWEHRGGWRDDD